MYSLVGCAWGTVKSHLAHIESCVIHCGLRATDTDTDTASHKLHVFLFEINHAPPLAESVSCEQSRQHTSLESIRVKGGKDIL